MLKVKFCALILAGLVAQLAIASEKPPYRPSAPAPAPDAGPHGVHQRIIITIP